MLLGSMSVKAVCKTLVKLTPVELWQLWDFRYYCELHLVPLSASGLPLSEDSLHLASSPPFPSWVDWSEIAGGVRSPESEMICEIVINQWTLKWR
jgi:hypothetical protein